MTQPDRKSLFELLNRSNLSFNRFTRNPRRRNKRRLQISGRSGMQRRPEIVLVRPNFTENLERKRRSILLVADQSEVGRTNFIKPRRKSQKAEENFFSAPLPDREYGNCRNTRLGTFPVNYRTLTFERRWRCDYLGYFIAWMSNNSC